MAIPEPIERVLTLAEQNPYFCPPWKPYPKQLLFLSLTEREALYGGAAYGAKSVALLMRALLYAHVPGYAGVMFRRTYPELSEPGGLIEMAHQWLDHTDAEWNETKSRWVFPTGALPLAGGTGVATPNGTLGFRHIQYDSDAVRVSRGATYQCMCWDELTTFTEKQYTMPQARLRRPAHGLLSQVPLAVRSGTNPGGEGHEWVKARFVDSPWYSNARTSAWELRRFIPSRIADNTAGDCEAYIQSLEAALDPVTLKRLMEGDWGVLEGGEIFDPSKLVIVQPHEVPDGLSWARGWDTAGSVSESAKFTASVRMSICKRGYVWVSHVSRWRKRPGGRDDAMLAIAENDGADTRVIIEHGSGDSGIKQADDHMKLLAGFNVECKRVTGDKITRAWPFARQWNYGNVRIVTGPWVGPFRNEAQLFNAKSRFKDQIDAASLAYNELAGSGTPAAYTVKRPKAKRGPPRLTRPSRRKVFG